MENILKYADGISIYLNDFFVAASADVIIIDKGDWLWVEAITKKYGYDGLLAACCYIADTLPLLDYQNDKFNKALKELNESGIEVNSSW